MARSKKRMVTLAAASGLILSALVMAGLTAAPRLYSSEPPEPQCVCAECERPCGSGHAAGCSAAPK